MFWNGSVCVSQVFENDTCSQIDACRSDFGLICAKENEQFTRCMSGDILTFVEVSDKMQTFSK